MKRRFTTALVMLLAFALLIGTTAITASAETTYTPIGGSTTLVKNLVVDKDANIPDITFNYTIRRGTPKDATATTIEILESPLGGGTIGTAAQQLRSMVFRRTLTGIVRPQAKSMLKNPLR